MAQFKLEPREYLRVRGELTKMELSLEQLQDVHAMLHTEYTLLQNRHKQDHRKLVVFIILFMVAVSGQVLKEVMP